MNLLKRYRRITSVWSPFRSNQMRSWSGMINTTLIPNLSLRITTCLSSKKKTMSSVSKSTVRPVLYLFHSWCTSSMWRQSNLASTIIISTSAKIRTRVSWNPKSKSEQASMNGPRSWFSPSICWIEPRNSTYSRFLSMEREITRRESCS